MTDLIVIPAAKRTKKALQKQAEVDKYTYLTSVDGAPPVDEKATLSVIEKGAYVPLYTPKVAELVQLGCYNPVEDSKQWNLLHISIFSPFILMTGVIVDFITPSLGYESMAIGAVGTIGVAVSSITANVKLGAKRRKFRAIREKMIEQTAQHFQTWLSTNYGLEVKYEEIVDCIYPDLFITDPKQLQNKANSVLGSFFAGAPGNKKSEHWLVCDDKGQLYVSSVPIEFSTTIVKKALSGPKTMLAIEEVEEVLTKYPEPVNEAHEWVLTSLAKLEQQPLPVETQHEVERVREMVLQAVNTVARIQDLNDGEDDNFLVDILEAAKHDVKRIIAREVARLKDQVVVQQSIRSQHQDSLLNM
jgi:hypothetical protein